MCSRRILVVRGRWVNQIARKQTHYKCAECGTTVPSELVIPISGKKYCPVCGEEKKKQALAYRDLMAYVCEIYGVDAPPGIIMKQVKAYKTEYLYTYRGMYLTIEYYYFIDDDRESHEPIIDYGIAFIPYYYDKARQYYKERIAASKNAEHAPLEEIVSQVDIIHIKDCKLHTKDSRSNGDLIDISEL